MLWEIARIAGGYRGWWEAVGDCGGWGSCRGRCPHQGTVFSIPQEGEDQLDADLHVTAALLHQEARTAVGQLLPSQKGLVLSWLGAGPPSALPSSSDPGPTPECCSG